MFYNNLLIYINAFIDEDDNIYLDNINNYKYLDKEFINEIKLKHQANFQNNIEVFGLISDEKTIESYEEKIYNDINKMFNNIIENKKIQSNTKSIEESFLNIYYDSIINEYKAQYPRMLKITIMFIVCFCIIQRIQKKT